MVPDRNNINDIIPWIPYNYSDFYQLQSCKIFDLQE